MELAVDGRRINGEPTDDCVGAEQEEATEDGTGDVGRVDWSKACI